MPTSITPRLSNSNKPVNVSTTNAKGESLYRGPVRRRRVLIGSAPNVPVPISEISPRLAPKVGIVARYAPSLTKQTKKYNEKVAGAI